MRRGCPPCMRARWSSSRSPSSPTRSRRRSSSTSDRRRSMKRPSRREFLKTAAAGSVAASLPTTFLRAQERPQITDVPPGDRVQIALIGAGGQGMSDTRTALRVPGVELTAVADIYDGRLTRAKELWGQQVFTSRDYRDVL